MKKIIAVFCIVSLLVLQTGCARPAKKAATLLDRQGNAIATIDKLEFSDKSLTDLRYRSYVEAVLAEAIEILAEKNGISSEDAVQKLFSEGFSIKTEFDPTVFEAAATVGKNANVHQSGCAVLDENSAVLAISSVGERRNGNTKLSPFSTIKPLSVYAPAMEEKIISWSTNIVDKPFSKITDESGKEVDWPTNPSENYTYQKTTLFECIKQSLNTASVHVLKDLGVKKSIEFLTDSFGLDLGFESNKLALEGENQVIGNMAMGYLNVGLTPVQLAACYQIFSRGGKYIEPHMISSITDENGNTVYTYIKSEKQVISEETAYIMNRLLLGVVSVGGTGDKAKVQGCELIGKTGTGSDEGGNWFVGVTPQYSCALWHGKIQGVGNIADELFTGVMEKMPDPEVEKFSAPKTVRKGVYCSESGKLFSASCKRMQIGYYVQTEKPAVCDAH